jgi:hypothetical protein
VSRWGRFAVEQSVPDVVLGDYNSGFVFLHGSGCLP